MAEFELSAISLPVANWWSLLQQEVSNDTFYTKLDENIHQSSPLKYVKRNGVWLKNDKKNLSPNSSLIAAILSESHSTPVGGHFGYHKTLGRVKACFAWPHMQSAVKDFIKYCDVCQRCKNECMSPVGLLQSLPIPERVWTDVSMDFIEGFCLHEESQ